MDEPEQRLPSPHGEALGLMVVEQGAGRAVVTVPYSQELVGDPETGVIHGGVLTTMLDNASATVLAVVAGRLTERAAAAVSSAGSVLTNGRRLATFTRPPPR